MVVVNLSLFCFILNYQHHRHQKEQGIPQKFQGHLLTLLGWGKFFEFLGTGVLNYWQKRGIKYGVPRILSLEFKK